MAGGINPQQLGWQLVINAHDYDGQGEGKLVPVNISRIHDHQAAPQTVQAWEARSRDEPDRDTLSKEQVYRCLPDPRIPRDRIDSLPRLDEPFADCFLIETVKELAGNPPLEECLGSRMVLGPHKNPRGLG
jgi:hypothetical protein